MILAQCKKVGTEFCSNVNRKWYRVQKSEEWFKEGSFNLHAMETQYKKKIHRPASEKIGLWKITNQQNLIFWQWNFSFLSKKNPQLQISQKRHLSFFKKKKKKKKEGKKKKSRILISYVCFYWFAITSTLKLNIISPPKIIHEYHSLQLWILWWALKPIEWGCWEMNWVRLSGQSSLEINSELLSFVNKAKGFYLNYLKLSTDFWY